MYKKLLYCVLLLIVLNVFSSCSNTNKPQGANNTGNETVEQSIQSQAGNSMQSEVSQISIERSTSLQKQSNDSGKEKSVNTPEKATNTILDLEIIINDQTDNAIGIFDLGMTKEKVKNLIKIRKMEITLDEDNGSAGSTIGSDYITFFFDKNDILYQLYVFNVEKFQTSKGLKYGDSIDTLKELYGEEFLSHDEPDGTVYQYKFSSGYFNVGTNYDNKVAGWGISREQ